MECADDHKRSFHFIGTVQAAFVEVNFIATEWAESFLEVAEKEVILRKAFDNYVLKSFLIRFVSEFWRSLKPQCKPHYLACLGIHD